MARERRAYNDEFKQKIVKLYNSIKPRAELIREYELSPSALSSWIDKFNSIGSLNIEDNRSDAEKELIKLRKENHRLKMENDILKQAALNMGRKQKHYLPNNSACEGLFGRMKNEMFYGRKWNNVSIENFIALINGYIVWYNPKK